MRYAGMGTLAAAWPEATIRTVNPDTIASASDGIDAVAAVLLGALGFPKNSEPCEDTERVALAVTTKPILLLTPIARPGPRCRTLASGFSRAVDFSQPIGVEDDALIE